MNTEEYAEVVTGFWSHAESPTDTKILHAFSMLISEFAEMTESCATGDDQDVISEAGDVMWAAFALSDALAFPRPDAVASLMSLKDDYDETTDPDLNDLSRYIQKSVQRGSAPSGEVYRRAVSGIGIAAGFALGVFIESSAEAGVNFRSPEEALSALYKSNFDKLNRRFRGTTYSRELDSSRDG